MSGEKQPTSSSEELNEQPAEFEFHQERFKKRAEKHNERGHVRRIVEKTLFGKDTKNLNPIDIARKEALRDNADFERRRDEEFEMWERHLQVVIGHLREKRDDPEGKGKEVRALLVIEAGGLRGPLGAAQVVAMLEMGYDATKFDNVFGVSTGSGIGAFYMAGLEQAYRGTAIYYTVCATKKFLNKLRLHHIMDARVAEEAMREGDMALDVEAVKRSPTGFWVAVTREGNDKAEIINAKTAKPDLISAVTASMNVPLLVGPGIKVNGIEYIDGGFDELPLQDLIDKFHPTDILVLPNVPFDRLETFKSSAGELIGARLFDLIGKKIPSAGTPGTIKKFLTTAKNLRGLLEDIKKEKNVNIGILWPREGGLRHDFIDPDTARAAVYDTMRATFKAFGEKPPRKIDLYGSRNK